MGRRRTQLDLNPAEQREAQRLLRSAEDARTVERARFALLGATGRHTLEELAAKLGRQRSTVQNWLAKFQGGGLAGLLERDTSPGITSPLNAARVQRQLQAGLKSGRWSSAAHVAAWLEGTHGITRSRKSIYYWFEKLGLTPTEARSVHRRQAPAKPPASARRSAASR